jgi:hypothetical protein
MTIKVSVTSDIDALKQLLDRAERQGLSGLSRDDRVELAKIVLGDPRCAGLLRTPVEEASTFARLLSTIRAAWIVEEWHVVLDYRNRLRTAITKVEDPEHPIAALILYATCFEHTLNAILIRQGLLNGLNAAQVDAMVRQSSFPAKLDWLPQGLGLPPFNETHRAKVARLGEVRNQYLHYKWRGHLPEAHEQQKRDLRAAVADLVPSLTYFEAYYSEQLLEPYVNLAIDKFAIARDDLVANA